MGPTTMVMRSAAFLPVAKYCFAAQSALTVAISPVMAFLWRRKCLVAVDTNSVGFLKMVAQSSMAERS